MKTQSGPKFYLIAKTILILYYKFSLSGEPLNLFVKVKIGSEN